MENGVWSLLAAALLTLFGFIAHGCEERGAVRARREAREGYTQLFQHGYEVIRLMAIHPQGDLYIGDDDRGIREEFAGELVIEGYVMARSLDGITEEPVTPPKYVEYRLRGNPETIRRLAEDIGGDSQELILPYSGRHRIFNAEVVVRRYR